LVSVYLRRRGALQESWDKEGLMDMPGMPEFISYMHLSAATKQFSDQSKLGQGGFGSVYQGVLPKTGARVAVKKVSSDSRQGEREFLAEVQIISQLRHRNVVELTGFCRDRGKFLLVYELLPNGSLDQALFKPKSPLPWSQRWKIVAGAAAALHYLHEGWRQQVIHRDVKSSNIMLDEEYNAKLGDFGLARLVDVRVHRSGGSRGAVHGQDRRVRVRCGGAGGGVRAKSVRQQRDERGGADTGGHGVAALEGGDAAEHGRPQAARGLRPGRDVHGAEAGAAVLASGGGGAAVDAAGGASAGWRGGGSGGAGGHARCFSCGRHAEDFDRRSAQ
jgi:serine/threonine protein kinase